ncbi:hypothetical protein QVD17_11515 [Tagetes erecta]|uniref:Phytocyanin domain-containing protein n=1 Tax=Tagetes erecta TaxID=13708 RepID=A0AAD8KVB3_TARER|nr:hypothetical protein QVD17_11515 [Tagetes erecta]
MAFNHIVVVSTILVALLLSNTSVAIESTQYVVGDSSGWTIDYDYIAWAKSKVFRVGDTLVFNYPKGIHNVFKVNGTAFANCIIPPPSEAYTSGHDIIALSAPGKTYFLCGVEEHCSEFNQKLAIYVRAS